MEITWFTKHKKSPLFKPVAWQGWLLLFTYIISLCISLSNITAKSKSVNDTLITFVPLFIAYTVVMYLIAYTTSGKVKK